MPFRPLFPCVLCELSLSAVRITIIATGMVYFSMNHIVTEWFNKYRPRYCMGWKFSLQGVSIFAANISRCSRKAFLMQVKGNSGLRFMCLAL